MSATPTIMELARATYLRPAQRRKLKASIDSLESMLQNAPTLESVHGIAINREAAQESLSRDKKMLEDGTPPDYPTPIKNRLFKVMQTLESSIREQMPTQDMMEKPIPANIDWHIAHSEQNLHKILAWKSIRRILDPHNDGPNFTNLDILRTNTQPKGDPRLYWKGFDPIKWSEEMLDELGSEIDESDYRRFLELKLFDWSERNIRRELDWTKEQYQVAQQRLHSRPSLTAEEEEEEDAAPPRPPPPDPDDDEDDEDEDEPAEAEDLVTSVEIMEWPITELKARSLTRNALAKLMHMPPAALYSALRNPQRMTGDMRERITIALERWDRDHAFYRDPDDHSHEVST